MVKKKETSSACPALARITLESLEIDMIMIVHKLGRRGARALKEKGFTCHACHGVFLNPMRYCMDWYAACINIESQYLVVYETEHPSRDKSLPLD